MPPRSSSMTRGLWTDCRFLLPVLGGVLLLFLVVPSPTKPEETELAAATPSGSTAQQQGRVGKLNREVIEGHDVLWQLPGGKVMGLLFFAHGCNHQATDVWTKADGCEDCLGLPEEVLMRNDALRLGYGMLAVSSLDRQGSRCWDVQLEPQGSVDGQHIARILAHVRKREGLERAPLYVLGASSGGAFVLMLPHLVEVQGVCAQIMGVPTKLLKLPSGRAYPPTLFVHMPRDQRTAGAVQQDMEALRVAGVPAAEIRVQPRPITAEYLRSRSPQLSGTMAAAIVKALRQGGMLGVDGLLLKNPRQTAPQWQALLREGVPGIDKISLVADESPVTELLNLAWAGHEIVSDYTCVALAWLAAGGKPDIGQLVKLDQQLQRKHEAGGYTLLKGPGDR